MTTPEQPVDRRQAKELARAQRDAERAAQQERAAQLREEAQQAKADEAFAASPPGRARAAFQRGDAFFQLTIEVSRLAGPASTLGLSGNQIRNGGRPDLLGQIEDEGFTLEHVGYVFIETGATSTNRVFNTGQGTVTRGVVQGIYLFRRREDSIS